MAYGNIYAPSRSSALARKIVSTLVQSVFVSGSFYEATKLFVGENRFAGFVILAALIFLVFKVYRDFVRREAELDEAEIRRAQEQNQVIRWHTIDTNPIHRRPDQRPN
jgi:hypothetical protein